ncbi:hypothetical protein AB0M46_16345 [Dactylosporangium sp. NPDC051485]
MEAPIRKGWSMRIRRLLLSAVAVGAKAFLAVPFVSAAPASLTP